MSSTPESLSLDKETHRTLKDLAYSQLRDDIVHGHFGPGTKLRIEQLREHYNMGATPLREALSRLTADGFVNAEGQRGFKVADITLDELTDITNLRVHLENLALQNSILKGDDHWEGRVVSAFHRLSKIECVEHPDLPVWEQRNRDFHFALISACTSKWLLRFYSTLYDQHKRYRNIARIAPSGWRDVHAEHQEIYDAALARDVERACQANEQHIRRTADVTGQVLAENSAIADAEPSAGT